MGTRVATRSICVCFLLLLFAAGSIHAAPTYGNVYLIDGTVFKEVSFSFESQFKILKIKQDGTERNVSLHKIARITGFDGEDITESVTGRQPQPVSPAVTKPADSTTAVPAPDSTQTPAADPDDRVLVLGEDYVATEVIPDTASPATVTPPSTAAASPFEQPQSPWVSGEAPARVAGRKPWFGVLFNVSPKMSIPIGSWFDGLNPGYGFDGVLRIGLTRDLSLRMMFSRVSLKPDNVLTIAGPGFVGYIDGTQVDAIIWRYLGGVEYMTPISRSGPQPTTFFYAYYGLGATVHDISFSDIVSDTQTKFTQSVGLGLLTQLTRGVSLDFGLAFDLIYIGGPNNDDYWEEYQTAGLMDLRIGLSFGTPRSLN